MHKPLIHLKNWKSDLLSGVIVALVSIPISMGYAQIAGLPPVYGLYGSVLPILVYGLLTTSPQFVVGVDAMPAVMVGNALTGMGFALGSADAVALVPVISLLTGLWFLVFWLLRAGRVVKYISAPVMGGFISGIGATIILMQLPKLFGGDPGTGELPALLLHLAGQMRAFHPLSALLGFTTVAVILIGKKLAPRLPVPVFVLLFGVLLTAVFHVDRYGVRLLPAVSGGLPPLSLPRLSLLAGHASTLVMASLSIALVVMAQTLLASNAYALKYGYRLDTRQELLAYAAAELAGSLVGCCPVNGSVSRAGIADQFQCKSQLMSLTAALVMLMILLFGTRLLCYLPVPILTGIVIAALIGIVDFPLARKLRRTNPRELVIFLTAFAGVLLFGTIYGVVIGVALSFFAVVVRAVAPPRAFLGQIPGHEGFYLLNRNRSARAIRHTVLYRFSGNLFFANIDRFQSDLEGAVRPDTRQIIVDGGGIGSVDMTAAERLVQLEKSFRERGIRLYLTEHVGRLNDQLRQFGAECLIENGTARRTIALALRDCGLEPPYSLEEPDGTRQNVQRDESESYAEFEWLYGDGAETRLEHLADELAEALSRDDALTLEAAERGQWGRFGVLDEETLLDYVEIALERRAASGRMNDAELSALEERVEEMRPETGTAVGELPPKTQRYMREHSSLIRERMQRRYPEQYARLMKHRDTLPGHRQTGQKDGEESRK